MSLTTSVGLLETVFLHFPQAKRQQRKLNFLITQTELYAHFIGKKLTGEADQSDKILQKLEDTPLQREIQPGVVVNLENPEDYDSEAAKAKALANVQSAFQKQLNTVWHLVSSFHQAYPLLSVCVLT